MVSSRSPVSFSTSDDQINVLHLAVAGELRHVRAQLEELAAILVDDAYFIDRYLNYLQNFDFLAQSTEESAAVLDRLAAGASAYNAIAPVRLGLVHERLHAALQRGQ